jgi:hypothetical protein
VRGWVYCSGMEQATLKIFAGMVSAFLFSGCQTIELNTGWDGGYQVGQVLGEKTTVPRSGDYTSSVGLFQLGKMSRDALCKYARGEWRGAQFTAQDAIRYARDSGIECKPSLDREKVAKTSSSQRPRSSETLNEYFHRIPKRNDSDLSDTFQRLYREAEAGDKFAQNNLGMLYESGKGVATDLDKALFWYESAERSGLDMGRLNAERIRGQLSQKFSTAGKVEGLSSAAEFRLGKMDQDSLCKYVLGEWASNAFSKQQASDYARQNGITCGPVFASSKTQTSTQDLQRVQLLEQRLAQLEAKQKSDQQAISQDSQSPSIRITDSGSDGARGIISGVATDNTGIAEVLVDGQVVPIDSDGRFSTSAFIPSGGIDIQITAYDLKGLSTTETVHLERTKRTQQVSRLAAVNPLVGPKQKPSRDRAALIIGLEKYEASAPAQFASRDAQMFADYAREKLGVQDNNLKILTDSGAGERNILEALRIWLPQAVKPGTTDLYIFYAGHGMPTADGTSAYLVPYDGDVRFLEDTAISRQRFFDEIGAAKPRSATFFFDNCYSGATRSEELLLASRPLSIKVEDTDVPDNYLVFTAGESNQTAGVLDEVKHGRFSYFVFKGLEGEADANQDGKISAGELHKYVRESVGRFSAGAQTPTMLGDAGRWVLR